MLALATPGRTVLGVELAADSTDPHLVHAFPGTPRVASRHGGPDLELLRFVRDGSLTGGHLHLGVDLAHPDGLLDEVAAALTAERPGVTEPVTVRPVEVRSATAELLVVGREPDDQGGWSPLVARPLGEVPVRVDAPHHAAFAVDLTRDGALLVESAIRSGAAPVAVVVRLAVEGLWPAQRVVARVDWGRAYDHVSSHLKEGRLLVVEDVARLVEELREDRVVVVEAVQGLTPEQGGSPADLDAALAWVQRELVERFCVPVLPLSRTPAHAGLGTAGEVLGVGTSFAAKRLTQVERAVATVDLQRSAVLGRTYTVQAHLADLLGGADPAAHLVDAGVDHPFFARVVLGVRSAVPLPDLGLAEVVGDLAFGATHLPVRLTPAEPEASASAWADAAPDGTWVLQATARFAADAPLDPGREVVLPEVRGRSRELTLDLPSLLGLARVDVDSTPDPRVLLTRVTLRHRRGEEPRAERDVVLTADQPAGSAWFRDQRTGDRLEAGVLHLLADGRAVAVEPWVVDTRRVVLPPAFPGTLAVRLVAADDWVLDGVRRAAVALQRHADAPTLTVVLDAPGAFASASLDLPDPVDRSFRHRVTRTFADGTERSDDWVTTDRPVVLVGGGAGHELVVDVVPVGPELPTAGVLLVEVELLYVDPVHRVRDQQTVVVRALADRPRWTVPLADPGRRSYEYRLTVHRSSGAVSVGSWTTSTDRTLVVPITRA